MSLSMEFFRQEYWSGLPCPHPGDLPDPGIEPRSLVLQADSLPSEPPDKLQQKNQKVEKIVTSWHKWAMLSTGMVMSTLIPSWKNYLSISKGPFGFI